MLLLATYSNINTEFSIFPINKSTYSQLTYVALVIFNEITCFLLSAILAKALLVLVPANVLFFYWFQINFF